MRTIAIVCGAGIAASAHIAQEVRDHIRRSGRSAQIEQHTVMDLLSPSFAADLVVTTVDLPAALEIPRVSAMPLLLGTDPGALFDEIDRLLGVAPSPPPQE